LQFNGGRRTYVSAGVAIGCTGYVGNNRFAAKPARLRSAQVRNELATLGFANGE
jgi:hypothetical protein